VASLPPSHVGPRDWDAEVYHRVSGIQYGWGLEVLERLPLRGDEYVLDAGCGSGRVAAALLERLPRGRLIAVDASPEMVEKAQQVLGKGVDVRLADLSELELEERVDSIFSNAVFHWVQDHARLFDRLHEALAPGGRLVAQCGGEGNVAALGEAIREVAKKPGYRDHLASFPGLWNFASVQQTAAHLEGAGFAEVRCWLEQKEVRPSDPHAFLRTIALGPHLARLPAALRDGFVSEVIAVLGEPLALHYVRLNIEACRPR
jgi:trans-aconitate 2-methyltransferase